MEPGISSYTFPWAVTAPDSGLTPAGLLDIAARHAIKFVQFGDNLPLHALPAKELRHIKETAAGNGIGIQPGARRLCMEHIRRYADLAQFFNAPFIRMVIDDTGYYPGTAEIIGIIKTALPLLRGSGTVLAIENHDRFSAAALRHIILETDPALVGVCLDTANSLGAGEGINEVLQVLAPHTVNVHIKDIRIERAAHKMGFAVRGAAAGEGIIDIPAITAHLKEIGRCKTATLEIWSDPLDSTAGTLSNERALAERSIHYLKQILI